MGGDAKYELSEQLGASREPRGGPEGIQTGLKTLGKTGVVCKHH